MKRSTKIVRPYGRGTGIPDPVDVHVGAEMRRRRMAAGLSQQALGELLGVSLNQIQKYETAKDRIGASRLYRLAWIFKVPVGAFFRGADTNAQQGRISVDLLDLPETAELIHAYYLVSDEKVRANVRKLLQAFTAV